MKKQTLVTCSFLGIRKDRPEDYYINQLNDFIDICEHNLIVYINHEKIKTKKNVTFIKSDPRITVKEIWPDENWEEIYQKCLSTNKTHSRAAQYYNPWLISVYLSKMELIRRLIKFYEQIVWVDSGLIASYVYDHNYNNYKNVFDKDKITKIFEIFNYTDVQLSCFDKDPESFHMPIEIIKKYAEEIDPDVEIKYITAAVMFFSSKNFMKLYNNFKEYWMLHINDGHAGIEENPLTLLAVRHKIKTEKISEIIKKYFIK